MKPVNTIGYPFIFILFVICITTFIACNPDDCEDEQPGTCDTCIQVLKPNIYIYPEVESQLNVSLSFPKGGEVTVSIPEYGKG